MNRILLNSYSDEMLEDYPKCFKEYIQRLTHSERFD